MIVTKGYGDDQMIVAKGYGTAQIARMRELLRLTSEIHPTLEVSSHYDF